MNKKDIYAAILAGGKGERLWPKSRAAYPKQNLKLQGRNTLFQNTFIRAAKIAGGNIFIIANKESAGNMVKQLGRVGKSVIVKEPFGRNTAPAVGLAALLSYRKNRNAVLVVMPSDHLIVDGRGFYKVISRAVREAVKTEAIITLGIKPRSAESAYGYIGVDGKASGTPSGSPSRRLGEAFGSSRKVVRFVEKPGPAKAARLISSGKYFWNSGIFVFKASVMLTAFKKYMPVLHEGLQMLPARKKKTKFDKELRKLYGKIKGTSLDYAVLEKSGNIRVIPLNLGWNDVGSFDSISLLAKKDKNGNAVFGSHAGIDTRKCIIFSDSDRIVGTVGVGNMIIVCTDDAVLVCDRKKAGDIRKLVAKMKNKKALKKFL
ncbi:MAG: mannose-1-phosphate guanylyltransferase [Candidatus Omnitrophica bacterium]|nr:mannose-1-phosphate guanylyltransferase [Candidatus Omnitrophota bacterium]